uniref:Uncharacterized protein n=1 Tax=Rhizophora mucronata TaxID=61149 RepID=A0A2P2NUA2_RHIMU
MRNSSYVCTFILRFSWWCIHRSKYFGYLLGGPWFFDALYVDPVCIALYYQAWGTCDAGITCISFLKSVFGEIMSGR